MTDNHTHQKGGPLFFLSHGMCRPYLRRPVTLLRACLTRITDDSRNGRPLTVMGFGNTNTNNNNDRVGSQLMAANRNLQRFFSKAREVNQTLPRSSSSGDLMISEDFDAVTNTAVLALSPPKHRSSANKKRHHHHHKNGDKNTCTTANKQAKPSVVAAAAAATGPSKLTSNLLGPAASSSTTSSGVAVAGADVELPWSCAISSNVNWMVGFSDGEGILTMCLKALPLVLADEQHRIAARGSGLTDIILRSMVSFARSLYWPGRLAAAMVCCSIRAWSIRKAYSIPTRLVALAVRVVLRYCWTA
jgi:hypothetical protein